MPVGLARIFAVDGGSELDLGPGPWRAIYVVQGAIRSAGQIIRAGSGVGLGAAKCDLALAEPDTRAYLWEVGGSAQSNLALHTGLRFLLSYQMPPLAEDDSAAPGKAIIRFERVDLFPGVETPPHTHRGSGLRVLITGELEAEIDGKRQRFVPGDAWIEKGPGETVIGRAAPEQQTSFVRLLVLPSAAAGGDSFVDLSKTPGDRPRPADYRRYFEEEVML